MILSELKVEHLSEEEAEDALRHVLNAAGAQARPAWPANAETRERLAEALAQADFGSSETAGDSEVARNTLQFLKQDPDHAGLRTDATDGGRNARSDFAGNAMEYMEATTLAMVALSTYVRVERGGDGKWKFVFEVRPQTDGMKKTFVKLVTSLVSKLPAE